TPQQQSQSYHLPIQSNQSSYGPTPQSSHPAPPQSQVDNHGPQPCCASATPTTQPNFSSPLYAQSSAPFLLPPPQQPQQQQPRWDMGLAAGGRISQKIHPDPLPRNSYNTSCTRVLNIQILNSVAFETCTGMLTPETP